MLHTRIDASLLAFYKAELIEILPLVKASHRMEALAFAFGFLRYASLTEVIKNAGTAIATIPFSVARFAERLSELGYAGIEMPASLQDIFSYRTYVAQKNGYGYEVVRRMAIASGCTEVESTIFAELLCAEPVSPGSLTRLTEDVVLSVLQSVPNFKAEPRDMSFPLLKILAQPLLKPYSGPAAVLGRISTWVITIEHGNSGMSTHVVNGIEPEIVGGKFAVVFRVGTSAMQLLRFAQEAMRSATRRGAGRVDQQPNLEQETKVTICASVSR